MKMERMLIYVYIYGEMWIAMKVGLKVVGITWNGKYCFGLGIFWVLKDLKCLCYYS